ncbi:hypothetical protein B5M44_25745 [Shinella sumterensis]|uniref:alpha/beta hydrolase n=1 Tax=Shinella sumterensis TaxID=1967501 RepID=UPI00106EB121|nr:alpha/beta fold hydrolase [Shinella sumterensis]MCD1265402.1 alpha/beta fold hydrolase [Shinella sumterensis]TFE93021.1 hypothetical protein B5M44_25745 [Shinella sumterensis]
MNERQSSEGIQAWIDDINRNVTIEGAGAYFHERGDVAVLALHGWGATAESVRFLASGLAGAGCSVLAPTLPGHGTSYGDMMKTGPLAWIACARAGLDQLKRCYRRVFVLGVSMGGALALQLGAIEDDSLAGVITVNAPLFLDRPQFALDLITGPADGILPAWEGPDFFGPPVPEITYPLRARKSGIDLLAMAMLASEALPRLTAPLLVLQSVHDHVVPKGNGDKILARSGSGIKSIQWLNQSYHMSQLDLDREEVIARSVDFIRSRQSES